MLAVEVAELIMQMPAAMEIMLHLVPTFQLVAVTELIDKINTVAELAE